MARARAVTPDPRQAPPGSSVLLACSRPRRSADGSTGVGEDRLTAQGAGAGPGSRRDVDGAVEGAAGAATSLRCAAILIGTGITAHSRRGARRVCGNRPYGVANREFEVARPPSVQKPRHRRAWPHSTRGPAPSDRNSRTTVAGRSRPQTRPRQESNLHPALRRRVLYPLSYEGRDWRERIGGRRIGGRQPSPRPPHPDPAADPRSPRPPHRRPAPAAPPDQPCPPPPTKPGRPPPSDPNKTPTKPPKKPPTDPNQPTTPHHPIARPLALHLPPVNHWWRAPPRCGIPRGVEEVPPVRDVQGATDNA